ncbi:hypothetical protein ACFLWA_01875 [Chloroflexota bacterium]
MKKRSTGSCSMVSGKRPTGLVYVARSSPSAIGDGGNHRAYQIVNDLERLHEVDRVEVIVRRAGATEQGRPTLRLISRIGKMLAYRSAIYLENPYKLFANSPFTTRRFLPPGFMQHYLSVVDSLSSRSLCLVDDARFAEVIAVNRRRGIRTIACVQNLQSLDLARVDPQKPSTLVSTSIDFAHEMEVLARCSERLFISKVETGLLGGLGVRSHYYPYRPVGQVRSRLEFIRQGRCELPAQRGMFLMLGSAAHRTTNESFRWFVSKALVHGLPDGVRVVIGGSKTETLLPGGATAPGIELKGWLEQDELDRLLVETTAVLCPQRTGFGALTRLSELACAGVPVLASRHASFAIDPTPGLHVVDDSWEAWFRNLELLAKCGDNPSSAEYLAWEQRQPRALQAVVQQLLTHREHSQNQEG